MGIIESLGAALRGLDLDSRATNRRRALSVKRALELACEFIPGPHFGAVFLEFSDLNEISHAWVALQDYIVHAKADSADDARPVAFDCYWRSGLKLKRVLRQPSSGDPQTLEVAFSDGTHGTTIKAEGRTNCESLLRFAQAVLSGSPSEAQPADSLENSPA